MSNERFIRKGQRCLNGLGMSSQGQSISTDGQSKQPPPGANAASGQQLKEIQPVQEVNTARVKRSGVRATSPALLFSFSQWNKPVPTPEDGQTQNMPRYARNCSLLCYTCALERGRRHFYNAPLVCQPGEAKSQRCWTACGCSWLRVSPNTQRLSAVGAADRRCWSLGSD